MKVLTSILVTLALAGCMAPATEGPSDSFPFGKSDANAERCDPDDPEAGGWAPQSLVVFCPADALRRSATGYYGCERPYGEGNWPMAGDDIAILTLRLDHAEEPYQHQLSVQALDGEEALYRDASLRFRGGCGYTSSYYELFNDVPAGEYEIRFDVVDPHCEENEAEDGCLLAEPETLPLVVETDRALPFDYLGTEVCSNDVAKGVSCARVTEVAPEQTVFVRARLDDVTVSHVVRFDAWWCPTDARTANCAPLFSSNPDENYVLGPLLSSDGPLDGIGQSWATASAWSRAAGTIQFDVEVFYDDGGALETWPTQQLDTIVVPVR